MFTCAFRAANYPKHDLNAPRRASNSLRRICIVAKGSFTSIFFQVLSFYLLIPAVKPFQKLSNTKFAKTRALLPELPKSKDSEYMLELWTCQSCIIVIN